MTPDDFRNEQRGVAVRMATAMFLSVVVLLCAWGASRGGEPVALPDRLALALKLDLAVVVWLCVMIGNVARLRFFSPEDIGGSSSTEASAAVANGRAVLQNTLEQVVLAVPVHLALAATLPRPAACLVTLVVLFSLGRLMFWLGFANGAAARALGFALTFYPTMLALLLVALTLVIGSPATA